ncbi:MAG: beta-propeller domain-containing protein [Labilithrix sp.]|nr:beta-propeller domain-containing protein [Labilithrix sp.]
MARSTLGWLLSATVLTGAQLVAGCGSGNDNDFEIDNGFESDDPAGRTAASRGESSSNASPGSAGSEPPADASGGKDEAQRAIEEADIIKQDGNRLFALSRYGGLAIVDITDPDHMKLLGRKRTDGMPFEMYVRDGRAYVMLNEFGRWVRSEGRPYGRWEQGSEIVSYDVRNPAQIVEENHYDVPGSISDSRLVGEVLYLVTNENGYCWKCNDKPGTIVTSFNVAQGGIAKVDQLAYTALDKSYSAWKRSVSATDKRLYIAGPEWTWRSGDTNAHSIIQVVDIGNPDGHLAKGAEIPVAGQINSRWQMDEHAGVLRVVSQYGNGWFGPNGTINPQVQTFSVTSASVITPLGSTELVLPKPESLRSVRFDGQRGYAITAERTDPLFTIDLSNPALPKQMGELEMPGWIFHMEPRGDRLIGFGWDDTAPGNAHLAVSLFDVSDLAHPTMLKRVSFGAGWGNFAEDQDRIHKSVRVLDDQNLVLVPFASYGRWDGTDCGKGQSGIQLIDFSRDDLVLRGIAPQYGMPRRALLANDRLLAISDRNVTSFDIASRDAPVKKGELDLSNPAYRLVEINDHIASITNDWWTGEALLSLTPKHNADDAEISGKLSLASLADPDPTYCSSAGRYGWTAWYQARLFAEGNFVYLTVPVYGYSYDPSGQSSSRSGKVVVAAIDVSNPLAPVIAGKSVMKLTEHVNRDGYGGWYGDGFWDGYGYYSYWGGMSGSLVGSGQGVVQMGAKLAYIEVDHEPIKIDLGGGTWRYEAKIHRKLHVADFSNPSAPLVHAPIDLGESYGASPLHIQNGVVMTSRWIRSTKNADKVRFFIDRVDINGAPQRLPSINTPGSLILADEASQRLVTVDYAAARTSAPDYQSCQGTHGWRARFDYDTKACTVVSRTFKLADIAGTRVTLRQTFDPPSQNIAGVQVADDRVYVTRYKRYDYASSAPSHDGSYVEPRVLEDGGLWAIGGVRAGQLSIVSEMIGDAEWPLAAHGTKVALYTQGGLAIYDTASQQPALVSETNLRGWGYSSHVLLGPDRAIASLGEWGLQTIKY